jgi:hypothetical protein
MAVFYVVAPRSLIGGYQRFRVRAASILIALIMEAESTSETSINFYQNTRRNNPEDSHLHARRSETLKSL